MTDALPMPEFVRKAIIAQGKYDPDEIEARSALVDIEAEETEQLRLLEEERYRTQRELDWWQK